MTFVDSQTETVLLLGSLGHSVWLVATYIYLSKCISEIKTLPIVHSNFMSTSLNESGYFTKNVFTFQTVD